MSSTIPGLTPYNQNAVPLVQRTLAAGSITSSYVLVGSIFSTPVIMLIISSLLDQAVQLSLDGVNDWLPMPAGGTLIIDEKTNGIALAGWRGIYAKRIGTPSTGSIYVSGFTT